MSGTCRRRLLATCLCLGGLLAACGQPVATPEPVYLRAAGSTTLGPLMANLAAAYAEVSPNVYLDITTGGSQHGLEALRAGQAEIAFVSWLAPGLDGPQIDPGWRATAIARDGIAVIVHPSNPVRGLGLLQLRDLFGGQAYEWSAVGISGIAGEVQPVSREEGSGTRAAFEALAMEGRRVSPRAIVATSSEDVVNYVAGHPAAIGYVSSAFVSEKVKALAIEGETPAPESVLRGSYALSRDLWLVTTDPPSAAVSHFTDFILSADGQALVSPRYIPLH